MPDYPSSPDYLTPTSVMTLEEARGHVIFLMDGTLTKYEDHYENYFASSKKKYLKHWLETSPKMELRGDKFIKQGYLENMGDEGTKEGNPDVKLVGTNTTGITKGSLETIKGYADQINKWFVKQDLTQGTRYGWIFMDYPTDTEIKRIIRTNPTFPGDEFQWSVTDDGILHIGLRGSAKESSYSSSLMKTEKPSVVQDCMWKERM